MKWDIDRADGVFWIATEAAESLCRSMKKVCGINFTEHLCYVTNHSFYWCTLESELEKIGNFLVKRFKERRFADKFAKDFREFYRKAVKQLDAMDKADFSKISSNELFQILKKASRIYSRMFDWGFIAEPMDFVMPDMIRKALKKKGYDEREASDMLAAPYTSFLNRENQELIRIAMKHKPELVKKHACKYRWMQSDHMGRRDIPLSYFEKRIKELKKKNLKAELEKLENFKRDTLKRRKEIESEKPLDKECKDLLLISDTITEIHDIRKELFLRSIYTADTARAEIAKRYGYTKDELAVFSSEEVLMLEKGKKPDKSEAEKRMRDAALYIDTKKKIWKIYSGKEAKGIAEKELDLGRIEAKEFKGMIASPGKAKGKVKIILSTKEMHKMEKGDIIVASMTKPEIAPALHKAAAIVTDEGGVACHAAIVSREMKIPCIIGTKIATSVLKDGDLIEVDADKGIVRKVK